MKYPLLPLPECVDIHDYLRQPISQTERNKRVGSYPYFGATGQVGWIDDFRQDGVYVLLGEDGAPFLDPNKAKAYLVKGKCWVNNHVHVLKGKEGICDDEYLCYVLNWVDYSNAVTGSTRLKLPQSTMNRLLIPAPPITEQRRIAARLKAKMAEVEKARKAVDEQLADSEALSHTFLRETFSGSKAEKWTIIPLGEAGEVVAGITLGRKTNYQELREVPYLRVANVKDGHLDLSDIKYIMATEAEIRKCTLQPGDILLTEGGDPDKLGRGTFWSGEISECIHQNHIYRVRFPKDKYMPEFIAAQIGSNYGKSYFFAHAKKTTGIATINQQVLKAFPLLSPPVETQEEIMKALSNKLQEAQRVLTGIKQIANDIDCLPRRLLSKTFEM